MIAVLLPPWPCVSVRFYPSVQRRHEHTDPDQSAPIRSDKIVRSTPHTRSTLQLMLSQSNAGHQIKRAHVPRPLQLRRSRWYARQYPKQNKLKQILTCSRYSVIMGRSLGIRPSTSDILQRPFRPLQYPSRSVKAVDGQGEAVHGLDHHMCWRCWWSSRSCWESRRGASPFISCVLE